MIMKFLGAGDSIKEVLDEYPSLTREDICACFVTMQEDPVQWGDISND